MNPMRERKIQFPAPALLLGLAVSFSGAASAWAVDCSKEEDLFKSDIESAEQQRDNSSDDTAKKNFDANIAIMKKKRDQKVTECVSRDNNKTLREERHREAEISCKEQQDAEGPEGKKLYTWDKIHFRCVDHSEVQALPDVDDCSSASVFTNLKGRNCKVAMEAVKDVGDRTSALTDATNAVTTAYSSMQATGATGSQDDAQTRQANIMKTLAISKLATGALNLEGAMQLKNAASGAETASSTISGAQKGLAAKCQNSDDDMQVCFFKHAQEFGVTADDRAYANFERMRQGASQSQDQADAANALAKTSMITGAADMLVGLQALKMAQMAANNAQNLAPPPLLPPPPPGSVHFGDNQNNGNPNLTPGASANPTDYGSPAKNGLNFGNQKTARIEGTMAAGKMGAPNGFKPATSSVSGGGGGGGVGGGSLRSGGGGGKGGGGKRNSATGEYNLAGGGGKGGGGAAAEKSDGSNPMADMLAKLFPPDKNGKPVVDMRQLASNGDASGVEGEAGDNAVTATELSIFEQISAKYRQLNGSGSF